MPDTIEKRYDFVLLFDVQDGNPNGDPDAGNLPRVDPETGHGLVTDVCIKRKVRNYVALAKSDAEPDAGFQIYVHERAVLNLLHREAYVAEGIAFNDPASEVVPEKLRAVLNEEVDLPDGFSIEEGEDEIPKLVYSGALEKDELKAALAGLKEISDDAGRFASELAKKTKSRKPKREDVDKARDWMCRTYFDVRTFGAVMSTNVNAGQVRGPVQLTFARSVDRILTQEHSVTRVAVTTEKEAAAQGGENRTMGRKATVPYGLYRAHGFVSPALAARDPKHRVQGTGFTDDDLALLFEALENMFEHDRSAARGLMSTRGLVIFEHDSALGNAPAHALFDMVKVESLRTPTRSFADYQVTVNDKPLVGVRATFHVKAKEGGFEIESDQPPAQAGS